MAERSIENMSAQDFRHLQEAPLSSDGESNGNDYPHLPTGQAIEANTLAEQSNTAGGQIQGGADLGIGDEGNAAFNDEISGEGFQEVLESDMDESFTDGGPSDGIHSPEMSDMNNPGEIDIDGLDEDAVMDLLPPDARLDPIED
ncbi:MAG TPA: hypothetical protein VF681_03840 [Abditibacteriaceae bacterium]|jgi:hypothetical protein